MKTNMKYVFANLAIFLLVFSSCEADLDVDLNDSINELDFLNNPDNAIQLVNGVYNKQLDYNMNGFSWIGMTSITSDDADKGSTASDTGTDKQRMDNLTFTATDISFSDVWQGRYSGIYRANNALFYLPQLNINEALRSRMIGEVEFLRALYYFDLVRCFGGVPVISSKVDLNDDATINAIVYTRKTKEETYAQIETDLLSAINKLPIKSAYGQNDLGRASKGAAQSLLAKVYLYQQKYQQAFDMAGEVIGSGQYSLLANYANVWREVGENGTESIYEVQATLTKGLLEYTNVQGPRGTPDLGWGFNTPSQTLVNSYEPGDVRLAGTVMFVPSVLWDGFVAPVTWTNPRYNYKAYQSTIAESWNGDRGQTAKNLRILKYSDVMLIRAEAGFQVGSSDALTMVNLLRERIGLSALPSVTLDIILEERRHEMAMEHDRWFDLIRTGQALSKMAIDGKTFVPGKHELFPIPQSEITKSGGRLLQNPGY